MKKEKQYKIVTEVGIFGEMENIKDPTLKDIKSKEDEEKELNRIIKESVETNLKNL